MAENNQKCPEMVKNDQNWPFLGSSGIFFLANWAVIAA